jgi:hypothetical protein
LNISQSDLINLSDNKTPPRNSLENVENNFLELNKNENVNSNKTRIEQLLIVDEIEDMENRKVIYSTFKENAYTSNRIGHVHTNPDASRSESTDLKFVKKKNSYLTRYLEKISRKTNDKNDMNVEENIESNSEIRQSVLSFVSSTSREADEKNYQSSFLPNKPILRPMWQY